MAVNRDADFWDDSAFHSAPVLILSIVLTTADSRSLKLSYASILATQRVLQRLTSFFLLLSPFSVMFFSSSACHLGERLKIRQISCIVPCMFLIAWTLLADTTQRFNA